MRAYICRAAGDFRAGLGQATGGMKNTKKKGEQGGISAALAQLMSYWSTFPTAAQLPAPVPTAVPVVLYWITPD